MKSIIIIDLIEYKLLEGIEEASFLKAVKKVHSHFLKKQKGFLRRQLCKTDNNHWVDMVYWTTKEDAQRAAEVFLNHPSNYPFVLMVSPEGIKKQQLRQIKAYT